jgi:cysteine desulfurase
MNVPVQWARGTIRFSTGKMTTVDEIERAVQIISSAYQRLGGKRVACGLIESIR